MVSLNDVLSRADVSGLEKMIGPPAVQLLSYLDETRIRHEELRRLLFNLYPPHELILVKEAWCDIVELLRKDEAQDLTDLLDAPKRPTPWHSLREMRIGRRTARHEVICGFFGFALPPDEEEVQSPSAVEITPSYGLFKHQQIASKAIQNALEINARRAVLHMPTGSGKTRTAMHIIATHLASRDRAVVVWLAYSEELCEQAASEFEIAWRALGNRPLSVLRFWGGHEPDLNDLSDGLVVAGLAKIYSRLKVSTTFIGNLADKTSLTVIDEAHQAVAETYSTVLQILQSKRQDASLLGLTATPGRSWDDIDQDKILAGFFDNRKVSLHIDGYDNPIEYLVSAGYLAKPVFRAIKYEGDDLSPKDLAVIREEIDIPTKILEALGADTKRNIRILVETEKLAKSHLRILLFASSVDGARILATALDAHGIVEARVVTGSTPPSERRRIIAWYKEPTTSVRVLCNFGVLTTGFDAPTTSAAVIGRPTKSLVLYSQMVGRAIRGERAGGNKTAEIVTVVDTNLPGFGSLMEFFTNWEDAGWRTT